MSIFHALRVYSEPVFCSAAMNMAIDEALLESASEPSIRFYRWNSPALSFGYFGKFAEVAPYSREHDLVRRWTGGGIVFHGEDLTYSIIVPAQGRLFCRSVSALYEQTHRAIELALRANGQAAELATVIVRTGPRLASACFANPVRADVLLNGQKIAGAAQRRTRRGLLQQGSIQNVTLSDDFPERFANELAEIIQRIDLDAALLARAADIAQQRYATRAWLERR